MSKKDTLLLKNLPKEAAKIVRQYRRDVVEAKQLSDAEERRKTVEKLTSDAQRALWDLRGDGSLAIQRLQGSGTKSTGGDQLLSETRRTKAWDRVKGVLDTSSYVAGGPDAPDTLLTIQQAVKDAVAAGDTDAYQALREELPTYLTSKRLDYVADILPTLLKPGESLVREQEVIGTEADVAPGWKRVEAALAQAEHAVVSADSGSKGSTPIDLEIVIPDYDDGETITIEAAELNPVAS